MRDAWKVRGGLTGPNMVVAPKTRQRPRKPPFVANLRPYGRRGLGTSAPRILRSRWEEHREISRRFTRSDVTTLSSEQLEALEALGYVGEN